MENSDKKFEEYLAEFRPRRPRALPDPANAHRVWPRHLAAVAAIAIALGASLWFSRPKNSKNKDSVVENVNVIPGIKREPPKLSLVVVTQMALKDPVQLDAQLTEASRRMLPDFRGSDSTLRVLAKE